MKDTVRELKRREKETLAKQDAQYIGMANKALSDAWESLSAYFLRHPLGENEVSEYSLAMYDIEQAIQHMDRAGAP